MSCCSLIKGINPKMCTLCFVLINSVLLTLSCVLIPALLFEIKMKGSKAPKLESHCNFPSPLTSCTMPSYCGSSGSTGLERMTASPISTDGLPSARPGTCSDKNSPTLCRHTWGERCNTVFSLAPLQRHNHRQRSHTIKVTG